MNMDLLEVLWKQDVDLGVSVDDLKAETKKCTDKKSDYEEFVINCEQFTKVKEEPKIEPKEEQPDEEVEEDLWAGFEYTVDTETGEYIIKKNEPIDPPLNEYDLERLSPIPEYLLEEALGLVDKYGEPPKVDFNFSISKPGVSPYNGYESLFTPIIQPCSYHQPIFPQVQTQIHRPVSITPYPIQHQSNGLTNATTYPIPIVPTLQAAVSVSFEPQKVTANGHGHFEYDALVPTNNGNNISNKVDGQKRITEENDKSYTNYYGAPIVTALSTSMNLTNNESIFEPISPPDQIVQEPSTVISFYEKNNDKTQNNLANTDEFLSELLTDEDLKLMDMAMNEGLYTMRSLDTNDTNNFAIGTSDTNNAAHSNDDIDNRSDSAISCLSSERLSTLSDAEWCDGTSNSSVGYKSGNYSPTSTPIAQKKHQLFGRNHSIDYESRSRFDDSSSGSPDSRVSEKTPNDKTRSAQKSLRGHLSRDERRARAMNLPMTVDDIINLPMDEFNEKVSKYNLTEMQMSLVRDIRRRGKNKVAAQNCRKRKLDQIINLVDEVKEMKDKKIKLYKDHGYATLELKRMKEKFQLLYRHVFQHLRDPNGNHYSPYQFSLQTAADGTMVMVPKKEVEPPVFKEQYLRKEY